MFERSLPALYSFWVNFTNDKYDSCVLAVGIRELSNGLLFFLKDLNSPRLFQDEKILQQQGQTDVRDDSKKNGKKADQCSKLCLVVLYGGSYSLLWGL